MEKEAGIKFVRRQQHEVHRLRFRSAFILRRQIPESVSTSLQYTTVLGKQLGMIVTWTTVSLPQVVKLRLSQALKKTPPPHTHTQTKQAICHHHVCGTVSLLVEGAKMAFNVEGCLCLIQEVHLRPLWLLSDITLPGLATT